MSEFWIPALLALAFGLWVLLLFEAIGTFAFWRWVFALGPRIWGEERRVPSVRPLPAVGTVFDIGSVRFRIVAPGLCLFRRKYSLFRPNSAFKGTLELRDGRLVARGRWPLGMVGLVAVWCVGVLQAGEVRNDTGLQIPVFVLAVPVFVLLVFATQLWFERRWLRRAVDEFIAQRART